MNKFSVRWAVLGLAGLLFAIAACGPDDSVALAALQAENSVLQSQNAGLESTQAELAALQAELAALQAENEALEAQVSDLERAQSETEAMLLLLDGAGSGAGDGLEAAAFMGALLEMVRLLEAEIEGGSGSFADPAPAGVGVVAPGSADAGMSSVEALAACDGLLKQNIDPRTGSYGASADQVNGAVLLVQGRYPGDCGAAHWSPAAVDPEPGTAELTPVGYDSDYGDFGPTANQCFIAFPFVDSAVGYSRPGGGLSVGLTELAEGFYTVRESDSGVYRVPTGITGSDRSGNMLVFWDHTDAERLPADGAHCWYYQGGTVRDWFSNVGN